MDWDRVELDARLVDANNRVRELERTVAWLRDLLEPAEQAHQRYRAELARLDGALVAMHQSVGRRTATEDERARYLALENQHQRTQDTFREWCWSPAACIEDRSRLGPPRSWSTRDADAIRTRIVATVAELQLADAQRDNLMAELRALDAQPAEADVPGSRSWLGRLLDA
jgi:chromosome segregation ATPase